MLDFDGSAEFIFKLVRHDVLMPVDVEGDPITIVDGTWGGRVCPSHSWGRTNATKRTRRHLRIPGQEEEEEGRRNMIE